MGTYALKRATLRGDDLFATLSLARALQLTVQLAFMLDQTYFSYNKWLLASFKRLPRMYDRLGEQVGEALTPSISWQCKLELLDRMSDVLDRTMVEDGIIPSTPRSRGQPPQVTG